MHCGAIPPLPSCPPTAAPTQADHAPSTPRRRPARPSRWPRRRARPQCETHPPLSLTLTLSLSLRPTPAVGPPALAAHCDVALTIKEGWSIPGACNGVPQFLSAFCPDHATLVFPPGDPDPDAATLALTLDDKTACSAGTHCSNRNFTGAVMTSDFSVYYGNISFSAKLAAGSGVSTTIAAYAGTTLGWGFDGASPRSAGISVGSGHFRVDDLGFDATAAFHQYDLVWAPDVVRYFVDGRLVFNTSAGIPAQSMPLWTWFYACGASYCSPFHYSKPVTAEFKYFAYTPNGTSPASCAPPPPPPAFCDPQAAVNSMWTAEDACGLHTSNASEVESVYCADHRSVDNGTNVTTLVLDDRMTCKWNINAACRFAPFTGATLELPSYVRYGETRVTLQASPADAVVTQLSASDDGGASNITWRLSGGGRHEAQVGVGAGPLATVALGFDPAGGFHEYGFVWTPQNVSFVADGAVRHTVSAGEAAIPYLQMTAAVSLFAGHGASVGANGTTARVQAGRFTPLGGAPAPCSPPTWRLVWQDEFEGSELGPEWTARDNCTHGKEAQLYVKEAVHVSGGFLHLVASAFAANKTDRAGKQHRFGSGWVDSASNRSNQALNDCQSTNPVGFARHHARWEIRAKMPAGHFWEALWLMPDVDVCWPMGGEVDILESDIWGQNPPYLPHAAYHWSASQCFQNHGAGAAFAKGPTTNYTTGFHVYSVESTARALVFAVDGEPYFAATAASTSGNLPQHPMYLILGNQLWENWDYPQDLPSDFLIDYVRVYEQPAAP